ncbi:hypothetical protein [Calothrix sp. NIES-3974]|uniref:hypothetical protein n=1 Tax=Calothrix sp. NIES-3974 TaxID=2005462 RepID=UPI0012FDFABA|nr:hypothetical protein [Calothrix sp. NIES-3974]
MLHSDSHPQPFIWFRMRGDLCIGYFVSCILSPSCNQYQDWGKDSQKFITRNMLRSPLNLR